MSDARMMIARFASKLRHAEAHGASQAQLDVMINDYFAEKPAKPQVHTCSCDFTNHCPVHGSRKITDKDAYIAQP